jgi:hypothetical protein
LIAIAFVAGAALIAADFLMGSGTQAETYAFSKDMSGQESRQKTVAIAAVNRASLTVRRPLPISFDHCHAVPSLGPLRDIGRVLAGSPRRAGSRRQQSATPSRSAEGFGVLD